MERQSVEHQLLIVGGGRMGEALLGGLLAAGHKATEMAVVELSPQRREELKATYADVAVLDAPAPAAGAVIVVKPGDVPAATRAVVEAGAGRILSLAAGVTTQTIEEAAGRPIPVIRAMPNTPALVRMGAAAISPGSFAEEDDLTWAEETLSAVGAVVRIPEKAQDAATGLSGSGPAYIFVVAEAMIEAGVLAGLSRDVAETLTFQTLRGAAQLLVESDSSPASLRAMVTSPGGTTAAGLRELERHGVRAAFLDAVKAATDRSRELGS